MVGPTPDPPSSCPSAGPVRCLVSVRGFTEARGRSSSWLRKNLGCSSTTTSAPSNPAWPAARGGGARGAGARVARHHPGACARTGQSDRRLRRGGHPGAIPFTPRAKKVLEIALREALSLGHNYIGTEHLLLGLVRENEGVAARILLDCGADAETVRAEVVRRLGDDATGSPAAAIGGDALGSSWFGGLGPVLQSLQTDIGQDLDRAPDSGDLLLTLASAPPPGLRRPFRRWVWTLTRSPARLSGCGRAAGPRPPSSRGPSAGRFRPGRQRPPRRSTKRRPSLRDEEKELRAALTGTEKIDSSTVADIRARLGLAPPADPPA